MVAQLEQDLFHLEGRKDRFDQDGGANRPSRDSELVLREIENIVPEPRLEMAFELRDVEVGAASLFQQTLDVVKEVEAEVEEAAGDRLAVDLEMSLVEVPPTWPHQQRRDLVVQPVFLALRTREIDPALDGVDQVHLTLHQVRPGRRVRILEVRHENSCPRVQRVD